MLKRHCVRVVRALPARVQISSVSCVCWKTKIKGRHLPKRDLSPRGARIELATVYDLGTFRLCEKKVVPLLVVFFGADDFLSVPFLLLRFTKKLLKCSVFTVFWN